jgi:hypothetical protein
LEFFFPGTNVPFFNGIFFSGVWFENFLNLKGYVFVYVLRIAGRKISVKGVYVFEDQGWYGLVALDGGYLLVYFLLGYDVTLGSCEGYSVGCLSVPDVFLLTKKLYKDLCRMGVSFVRFHPHSSQNT